MHFKSNNPNKAVDSTATRVTPRACRCAAARVAPRASVGDLGRSEKISLAVNVSRSFNHLSCHRCSLPDLSSADWDCFLQIWKTDMEDNDLWVDGHAVVLSGGKGLICLSTYWRHFPDCGHCILGGSFYVVLGAWNFFCNAASRPIP
jgi:hypothetical protein